MPRSSKWSFSLRFYHQCEILLKEKTRNYQRKPCYRATFPPKILVELARARSLAKVKELYIYVSSM
jgi:hypothetical protein